MTAAPPRARRRRFAVGVGVVVVALAGWLLGVGGLAERGDGLVEVQAGAEIDAGNLVFTVDRATVQQLTSTWSEPTWQLVVTGTVRNPHQTTLEPVAGSVGNFLVGFGDDAILTPARSRPFEIAGSAQRPFVLPDDRAVELTVRFEPEADFAPAKHPKVAVGVVPMEFTDNLLYGLGFGQARWNKDSAAPIEVVILPLEVLPPTRG